MSMYKTEDILNFALVGHGSVGKTILAEAMLLNGGAINRLGTIEAGNTVSDYHEDEIERQISINTSVLSLPWEGKKFNILDTPGYADFSGEMQAALRVADFAVVVIHAVSNVEVGTEQVWNSATNYRLPHLIVVNMVDKEHADFDAVLSVARERFGSKVFPLTYPVNQGPGFNQLVDVLRNELHTYETDGTGQYTVEALSGDWADRCATMHGELIEFVAESDDTLLEKYFENDELTEEELRGGLHGAFMNGSLIPVFATSALTNVGIRRMMDVLAKYAPCAADFEEVKGHKATGSDEEITRPASETSPTSAFVFKTVSEAHLGELSFLRAYSGKVKVGADLSNTTRSKQERMGTIYTMQGKDRKELGEVVAGDIATIVKLKHTHTGDTLSDAGDPIVLPSIHLPEQKIRAAIAPKAKGDEDKISNGLATLHEEDPTFIFEYDPELKQTIISGQGELHLETVIRRLQQRFKVEVDLLPPKVAYRETINARGESKYRHKKQTGGAGQFAEVWMYVEPLPPGAGIEFESKVVGMAIDRVFIPSIEKGVRAAEAEGVLAGYRCVDLKAVVYDGKQHPVDSKDIAFQIAGREAFKEAFLDAKPKLLEPIYEVDVLVPEEFMGDVMGDISSRRGKVLGMETEGRLQKVKAQIPLANLDQYATALRSMTGGRGIHSQRFDHYEDMPRDEEQKVIAAAKKEKEEAHN
ncbi:MAG: elongation factor G [Fidelibacterota bacterium]|nr:MAG: elongation factor G [Candidatus Neomarinimicrobiota bacterium]